MNLNYLNKIHYYIYGGLFSTFLLGCATILTGSSQSVTINSEPSGAQVYINGNAIGSTPLQYSFNKSKNLNIMLKKERYESASAVVERHFNFITVINVLFWPGFIVDIATGAMWSFDNEAINAKLEPKK